MTTPRDLSQVGPPTPSASAGEARRGRAPPASWMDQLERSLRTLAARGGPRSLAVARTMCANVAANPEEARYRLIRLDNQSFHRRVWDVEGGRDVCHALGWHHVPADADGQGAVVVLPKEVVIPESAVSLIQSMINEHAAIARREHAAAPTPTDPDAADGGAPASPLGYRRRSADPFGGAGAASPPEPGSPRERYLADLRERRARRDEERERVLSRVEDDRRFGGGGEEEEEEESDGPGAAFSFSGARAPWCTAGEARGDGVGFFRTRRGAAPARRRIPRLRRHSHVDESFSERLAAEAERERYADAVPLVPVASESIAQGAGGGAT